LPLGWAQGSFLWAGTDLSKLTTEEQTRWKRAKARQYSASARRRHAEREGKLRDTVKALSIYRVLIKAAPDAVLLLSYGVQARILFANDRCSKLLRLPLWGREKQSLVGRCLWEWMDAADKATVVAAIATGTSCSDTQHLVRCTLRSPSSVAQQKQQQQQQQREQHKLDQQQRPMKVELTLSSINRGLIIFLRPEV